MDTNERNLDSILVALDGSQPSQTAASLAIEIARREKLLIEGLYVVDDVLVMDPYLSLEEEEGIQQSEELSSDERVRLLENEGDTMLRWLEDRCQAHGVPVQTDLMFGGMPELIITKAQSARLLAMGRRGRGHAQDTASLGHNFRDVAHHPPAPMLIGGDHFGPIKRILLAFDDSLQARHALIWANLLQQMWQSHLLVLSVAGDRASSRWLEEMKEQIGDTGLVNYRFIGDKGEPAERILQTVDDEEVDMIVMGGHQHSAIVEWLTGSTLDRVLRNTEIPLLMTGKQ